jgi:hypothetical protein
MRDLCFLRRLRLFFVAALSEIYSDKKRKISTRDLLKIGHADFFYYSDFP